MWILTGTVYQDAVEIMSPTVLSILYSFSLGLPEQELAALCTDFPIPYGP